MLAIRGLHQRLLHSASVHLQRNTRKLPAVASTADSLASSLAGEKMSVLTAHEIAALTRIHPSDSSNDRQLKRIQRLQLFEESAAFGQTPQAQSMLANVLASAKAKQMREQEVEKDLQDAPLPPRNTSLHDIPNIAVRQTLEQLKVEFERSQATKNTAAARQAEREADMLKSSADWMDKDDEEPAQPQPQRGRRTRPMSLRKELAELQKQLGLEETQHVQSQATQTPPRTRDVPAPIKDTVERLIDNSVTDRALDELMHASSILRGKLGPMVDKQFLDSVNEFHPSQRGRRNSLREMNNLAKRMKETLELLDTQNEEPSSKQPADALNSTLSSPAVGPTNPLLPPVPPRGRRSQFIPVPRPSPVSGQRIPSPTAALQTDDGDDNEEDTLENDFEDEGDEDNDDDDWEDDEDDVEDDDVEEEEEDGEETGTETEQQRLARERREDADRIRDEAIDMHRYRSKKPLKKFKQGKYPDLDEMATDMDPQMWLKLPNKSKRTMVQPLPVDFKNTEEYKLGTLKHLNFDEDDKPPTKNSRMIRVSHSILQAVNKGIANDTALADIFRRFLSSQRLRFTQVETSRDLSTAYVYWHYEQFPKDSTFYTARQTRNVNTLLLLHTNKFRSVVQQQLDMKFAPMLIFEQDPNLVRSVKLDALLGEAESELDTGSTVAGIENENAEGVMNL